MLMMPFSSNRVTMKNVSLPKRHDESWRREICGRHDDMKLFYRDTFKKLGKIFRKRFVIISAAIIIIIAGWYIYTKVEAISIEKHTHDFNTHLSMSTLPSCSFNSIFRYLYIPHLLLAPCFQNDITVIERLGIQLSFILLWKWCSIAGGIFLFLTG